MDEHHDAPPLRLPNRPSVSAADSVSPPSNAPRVAAPWLSSVIVAVTSIIFALGSSIVALTVAMFVSLPPVELTQPEKVEKWLDQFVSSPSSLLVLVFPGQLTFLALALAGGVLSREPVKRRLACGRGRVPLWQWLIFAFATPCIGYVSGLLIKLSSWEPSQHLVELEEMIGMLRDERFFLVMIAVAFLPGICEELLFRGYVQSRLIRTWPFGMGILFSSVCFAIAHLDPMHIVAVFPIGLWLGVIAWRCESVWPAMLGHIANNGSSILLSSSPRHPEGYVTSSVSIGVSALCLAGAIAILLVSRTKRNDSRQATAQTMRDFEEEQASPNGE